MGTKKEPLRLTLAEWRARETATRKKIEEKPERLYLVRRRHDYIDAELVVTRLEIVKRNRGTVDCIDHSEGWRRAVKVHRYEIDRPSTFRGCFFSTPALAAVQIGREIADGKQRLDASEKLVQRAQKQHATLYADPKAGAARLVRSADAVFARRDKKSKAAL